MEGETLVIWYSTVYSGVCEAVSRFEQQDSATAKSFTERYKTWLAVHALLKLQDDKNAAQPASARRS